VDAVETVALAATDVILIEGVVALALETPATAPTHRFYVDIDEQIRKQRILNEYRLRGKTDTEAMAIYLARMEDEFPEIGRLACSAVRTSLSLNGDPTESHESPVKRRK